MKSEEAYQIRDAMRWVDTKFKGNKRPQPTMNQALFAYATILEGGAPGCGETARQILMAEAIGLLCLKMVDPRASTEPWRKPL